VLKILQPKRKEFLVLDFGQNSVKGLIFEIKSGLRQIKKFDSQKIERFGVFRAEQFELDIVKKAAQKLISALNISNKIKELSVIIGGFPDILRAKVIEVSFQRKKGEEKIGRIEEKEIYQNILEKGERKLIRELQKTNKGLKILKKKILEKKISGYPVPSLLGFRGKNLNFKVLFIFAASENFRIIPLLLKILKLKEPKISHGVEGLINLVEMKGIENRIFVDIGGKTTQVFGFKKGVEFTESFPLGGDEFTLVIAKHFGIKESEAENLKQRLTEGQLSSQLREEIERIISPVVKRWLKLFTETLKSKDREFFGIWQKISFLGGGSMIAQIKKEVQKNGFEPEDLTINELPLKNKTKIVFSLKEIPTLLLSLS